MASRVSYVYTSDAGDFFTDSASRYLGASADNQIPVAELNSRRCRHVLVTTKEPTAVSGKLVSIGRTRINAVTEAAYTAAVKGADAATIVASIQGEPLPPIPAGGTQVITSKKAENLFSSVRGS